MSLRIFSVGLAMGACLSRAGFAVASTEVLLRRDGAQLQVEVTTPEKSLAHALGPASDRLQASGWRIEGKDDGMTLGKGLVRSDAPTRRYRLRVPADTGMLDRVYGANIAIGGCAMAIRPNAFVAPDATLSVRVDRARGEQVVSPGGGIDARPLPPAPAGRNAHYFIADADCLHPDPGGVWIYDARAVPAPLLASLKAAVPDALQLLQQRFEGVAPVRPTVAVSYEVGDGGFSWRGDVDQAGSLLLRMRGEAGQAIEGDLARQLDAFIIHEVFHFWNGVAFSQEEGSSRAWLSEGSAEYAAQKLLRDLGKQSDEQFLQAMGGALDRCLESLAGREGGIDARDARGGRAVYDCGSVIQWLGDHELAGAGSGFFPAWRSIFRASAGDGRYRAADYFGVLPPSRSGEAPSNPLMAWLVWGNGDFDAPGVVAALGELGIRASLRDPPQVDPRAVRGVMMHLLSLDCREGPYGYSTEPDRLRLDTGDRCSALSGDPEINKVNGLRIGVRDLDLHASVMAACQAGSLVTLTLGATRRELPCTRPLPVLPPTIHVAQDGFSPPR